MPYLPRPSHALCTCIFALVFCGPANAVAQTEANEAGFTPTVALGGAAFVVDVWEDPANSTGVALRGGVRLPYVDIALLAERWGDVNDFRLNSAHLEASYFVAGERTLSPVVIVGLGYAWSRYRGEPRPNVRVEEIAGLSAAYGVGLHLAARRAWGVRTEGFLRTDDGGYNGDVRLLLAWAPQAPELRTAAPDARIDVGAYWMVALTGPWRFVEPGYVVRFERPFHEALSASLALGVFHWQIPGRALFRDYVWDTRAFTAMPGAEWHPMGQRTLSIRAGPSLIMMGEGPGNGVNVGAHLETAVSRPWGLPVSIGAGWLWMPNDGGGDRRVVDADQTGLTLFGGLHF